jgi:hypothetical protein
MPNQEATVTAARMLSSDHGLVVGQTGPLCVAIWRGSVSRPRFERQRAGLSEVVKRHPGAAFLCVIELTANPPNDELRQASVQMVASFGTNLTCAAVVIEGEGFRAAVTRRILSAMLPLRRAPHPPVCAFSAIASAVRWIKDYVPMGDTSAVASSVEELRRFLPPLIETF